MLSKRNSCIALTVLLASFSGAVQTAQAEGAKTVMPVSASWGSEQSLMHSQADNSGRQLALAPTKLPPKTEVLSDVASARQMAEFTDAVTVTARRVSKEGTKQFAHLTRWLALLWKQQTSTPAITPAAGPAFSAQTGIQSYRGQPMRSVTPKHPLWLLTDGRMKTVTAQ